MKAWLQPIIYWVNEYYGNRWYLLLAIVAYIYLFLQRRKADGKLCIQVCCWLFWY